MKLSEAISAFLEPYDGIANGLDKSTLIAALDILARQFANLDLDDLTPAMVRDFLARWYVEEASTRPFSSQLSPAASALPPPGFPDSDDLIESLKAFFGWAGRVSEATINRERLQVLDQLTETVPRAVAISVALAAEIASRGGAFAFPEFLTSFTEGGQSEYDVGSATGGEVGAREGYFRVLQIDGKEVAAEEMIQEQHTSPILFPEEIARLLERDYILNLEIVRTAEGWQIVNCGFAYPPGTEL